MWTDRAELLADVSAGGWIREYLTGFGGAAARNVIPAAFPAYARVFHPVEEQSDPPVFHRWAEVAAVTGREFHPGAQWHHLIGASRPHPHGSPLWPQDLGEPRVGHLEVADLLALAGVLASFTRTPEEAYFAVWEGWGQLNGGSVRFGIDEDGVAFSDPVPPLLSEEERCLPKLETPGRAYHLLRGDLADLEAIVTLEEVEIPGGGTWSDHQSPSLWWPADRAWCVATEIDFDSTLVGGSAAAIDAVLASPDLEALPIHPDIDLTWDA
ncbi:MAG: hypothetical protein Q4G64_01765, partial [bacterium]|nr:hypothetical protein [bacterium]